MQNFYPCRLIFLMAETACKKKCKEPKYKCPQCFYKYCSLECFKKHKLTCAPITKSENNEPAVSKLVLDVGEKQLDEQQKKRLLMIEFSDEFLGECNEIFVDSSHALQLINKKSESSAAFRGNLQKILDTME